MQIDLTGHRAVVTGGSAGIGAASVEALAAAGAAVMFCARDANAVDHLVAAQRDAGRDVHGFVADMGKDDDVRRFLDAVDSTLSAPSILVNNVGQSPSRNFLHMKDDDWHDLFDLNVMSAVRCTRHFLPAMRRAKAGRIVMVSSSAARSPNPATIDYGASKAAMVNISKSLATKYGPDNILVNSVLPGLIETPMWERAAGELGASSGKSAADVIGELGARIPLRRFGTAHEVAATIVFLCSEFGSYITGTTITIDGGAGAPAF